MGWAVWVVEPVATGALTERTPAVASYPPAPEVAAIEAAELASLPPATTAIVDVTTGVNYARRHIPGAWFAVRAQLAQALDAIPRAERYVLTCDSGLLARYAAADLRALLDARAQGNSEVRVLNGGNAAWFAAGLPEESGDTRLATPRSDRYRRPYEGTDAPREAMQGYLDWEFGLVDQLARDGTHRFTVI